MAASKSSTTAVIRRRWRNRSGSTGWCWTFSRNRRANAAKGWPSMARSQEPSIEERHRLADERDRLADERETLADQRERLADERQHQADARERSEEHTSELQSR